MAQLPRFDPKQVALKSDIVEFRAEFRADLAEFRAEFREGLAAVNQRMDRLFLTMLVGTFGIVATMLGVILSIR